ncbi:Isoaspartyl aminopeptidase @ Asp-X dipeptidase [hydrothermal vent metagenome]|uniref:Isoaspartyl aminopeptidase @ Asp-X dipeptidase n=1 Tax=hydrothermal vent metagenome TaxID=652676 RepID=A0A3B0RR86_9ZZZZ
MKTGLLALTIVIAFGTIACSTTRDISSMQSPDRPNATSISPIVILIHGGAGSARPSGLPEEEEAAYRAALSNALSLGYEVLQDGGNALDAVESALVLLEDNNLFNAARGAVLTAEGKVALDALIMDGSDKNAGAVAGVQTVKNPIKAARAVMQQSPHVMLAGKGADQFAKQQGLETAGPDWFITEKRRKQLQRVQEAARSKTTSALPASSHFGTVGAVALDRDGHLAAGTSTGGMTNKKWGRIGDSPIVGAGTYADDNSCAVSATGWGEFFIRATVARDICARIQWTGADVQTAADQEIYEVSEMGGSGGVLVLAPNGSYAFSFSTDVMFRGVKTEMSEEVAIFADHGTKDIDH